MAKVMTIEEARSLVVPCEVWFEPIGGFERTRYPAEQVTATRIDAEAMMFGGSGRAWCGYNKAYCGWRLWTGKPTHEEKMAAAWIE